VLTLAGILPPQHGISLENISGPVGILQAGSTIIHSSWYDFGMYIAFISVSLAFMNLLPLPLLDGGHILFLAIEKIRGRQLAMSTQQTLSRLSFYGLLSLMIYATSNDILRLLP
jgi:regulator of sigma E protease